MVWQPLWRVAVRSSKKAYLDILISQYISFSQSRLFLCSDYLYMKNVMIRVGYYRIKSTSNENSCLSIVLDKNASLMFYNIIVQIFLLLILEFRNYLLNWKESIIWLFQILSDADTIRGLKISTIGMPDSSTNGVRCDEMLEENYFISLVCFDRFVAETETMICLCEACLSLLCHWSGWPLGTSFDFNAVLVIELYFLYKTVWF